MGIETERIEINMNQLGVQLQRFLSPIVGVENKVVGSIQGGLSQSGLRLPAPPPLPASLLSQMIGNISYKLG